MSSPHRDLVLKKEVTKSSPAGGWEWSALDLCCGIGGLSLAARQLGVQVLGGVDLSPSALSSFKHNFPSATAIAGDISKPSTIASCEVLLSSVPPGRRKLILSGPPCQGFSAAGPRVNRDPRNRIIMSVAKAIVRLAPDAAIIENVSALISPKHVRRLNRFRNILIRGGYNLLMIPLNAAAFGVPQVRHRVIFFVSKSALDEPGIKALLAKFETPNSSVKTALGDLPEPPEYSPSGPQRVSFLNHVAMRHSARVKRKIAKLKQGTGPMSYRKLLADSPARTLISGNRAPPAHYDAPRSITVREAARLQGFPDDFAIQGVFSKQMLQVTNAVPPPLAQAAISSLLSFLGRGSANGANSTERGGGGASGPTSPPRNGPDVQGGIAVRLQGYRR